MSYQRHVLPQPTDQLLTFTHAVQARILGSPTTIAKQVAGSRLPRAALDPGFRKIARPRGAIMQKVVPAGAPRPQQVLAKLNDGSLTAAPAPPDPTGQIALDDAANSIEPPPLPEWLLRLLRSGALTILIVLAILALALAVLSIGFAVLGIALLGGWCCRPAAGTTSASGGHAARSLPGKILHACRRRQDRAAGEFRAHRLRRRDARGPRRRRSGQRRSGQLSRRSEGCIQRVSARPLRHDPIPPPLQLENAVTKLRQAHRSGGQRDPARTIPAEDPRQHQGRISAAAADAGDGDGASGVRRADVSRAARHLGRVPGAESRVDSRTTPSRCCKPISDSSRRTWSD